MTAAALKLSYSNPWGHVMTAEEIEAYHALTASLDPRFAASERQWYEGRTANQLKADMASAWWGNLASSYQLARSYLKLRFGVDHQC